MSLGICGNYNLIFYLCKIVRCFGEKKISPIYIEGRIIMKTGNFCPLSGICHLESGIQLGQPAFSAFVVFDVPVALLPDVGQPEIEFLDVGVFP